MFQMQVAEWIDCWAPSTHSYILLSSNIVIIKFIFIENLGAKCAKYFTHEPINSSHNLKRQGKEVRKLRPQVTHSVAELEFEPCWLTPEPPNLVFHCVKLPWVAIS